MIGYIITHCTCICPSLDPCFSLSFSFNPYIISVRLYCHCYSIGIILIHVSLSLSLSVSVSGYVTGNLHIYEQVGPAQTVCNSVIERKEKEKKKEKTFFFRF